MVTSRLTSTFRLASSREPVDRLTLTMAGSSCGVIPMAMARENSNASSNGRDRATLMTKIEIVSTAATRTSSLEKSRSPTWNAVSACRSLSPTAILPNAVADPVDTTTASTGALVHDRAHERARGEVDRRVARGRLDRLRRRHRLPGEHALVALELA